MARRSAARHQKVTRHAIRARRRALVASDARPRRHSRTCTLRRARTCQEQSDRSERDVQISSGPRTACVQRRMDRFGPSERSQGFSSRSRRCETHAWMRPRGQLSRSAQRNGGPQRGSRRLNTRTPAARGRHTYSRPPRPTREACARAASTWAVNRPLWARTTSRGDSAATDEMCMASGYIFPATKATICYNNFIVP